MTFRKFSIALLIFVILLIGAYVVSPYSPLFKGQLVISQSTQAIDTSVGTYITTDASGVVVVDQETDIHVYAAAPARVFAVSAYIQFDPEFLAISRNNITLSTDFSVVVSQATVTENIISFSIASTTPVQLSVTKPIATIKIRPAKTGITGMRVLLGTEYPTSVWSTNYPSENYLVSARELPIGSLTVSSPVVVTVGGGGGGGGGVAGGGISGGTGGGVVTQPPTEGPCFPDTANHPYGEDVFCTVKKAGIFQGYPDGSFGAKDLIDRAQMATVLARSLMSEDQIASAFESETGMHAAAYVLFPDVSLREWFAKYIFAAKQLGLIQGHEDGTFKPADNVNYVEAVKMIVSFAAERNPEIKAALAQELQIQRGSWYIPYVRVAQTFELVDGQPMALLRANPAGAAKREWVAYVISKIPGL